MDINLKYKDGKVFHDNQCIVCKEKLAQYCYFVNDTTQYVCVDCYDSTVHKSEAKGNSIEMPAMNLNQIMQRPEVKSSFEHMAK